MLFVENKSSIDVVIDYYPKIVTLLVLLLKFKSNVR